MRFIRQLNRVLLGWIGIQIPPGIPRLASAAAEAETIDKGVMEESLFANRQVIQCATSLGVVMRREFSDPEYPRRVDREIRRWLRPSATQSVLLC